MNGFGESPPECLADEKKKKTARTISETIEENMFVGKLVGKRCV